MRESQNSMEALVLETYLHTFPRDEKLDPYLYVFSVIASCIKH